MAHDVPEITPEELVQRLESGAPMRVLDVRAPAAVAAGRIDLVPAERFINIRGSELLAMGEGVRGTIPANGPIAVVCGRGNSSKQVAVVLNDLGYTAISMRGGMAAWDIAVMPRRLPPPVGFDLFVQFDRIAKGATGYLLASRGEAFLVDPPRKAQPYLEYARESGCRVVGVADTHVHADYISGGPAIARSLKVPYYLHPGDAVYPFDGTPAKIEFTPVADGTAVAIGGGEVRVQHTPGHTEGSVTYRAGDVALTGDFVFVNSVGRPDLGGKADAWTLSLWNSLERARREWGGDVRIHPAHYASEKEREKDHSVGCRFADVLQRNEPLRIKDQAAFVAWVGSKVSKAPDAYRKIKAVNLGLLEVWEMEAQELEGGRNECAVG
ncbi:MAG TPA: MBL fold metallo-hydrolase [Candidatus Limnocylindrales bacterium]|nr:MBL fold metallo-hydrolase [Candidatus Limnocylindrales bacterium]